MNETIKVIITHCQHYGVPLHPYLIWYQENLTANCLTQGRCAACGGSIVVMGKNVEGKTKKEAHE